MIGAIVNSFCRNIRGDTRSLGFCTVIVLYLD